MTKRGVLLVLDSVMFLAFVVLMSWRLSGITAHEWIGLSLIALILAHLLVHWTWVEGTVKGVMNRKHRRGLIALLLNSVLFMSMGTALVSGLVISKVVFANDLTPSDYLHWHSLHDGASTITVFILGLHVALNWDRIRSSVRGLFSASRRDSRRVAPSLRVLSASVARRFVCVVGVCVILVAGVLGGAHIVPTRAQVLMTFSDGHRELVSPPAEIARIQRGSTAPDLQRGSPRFVLSFVLLSITAVIGRRLLKLRLSSAQRGTLRNT